MGETNLKTIKEYLADGHTDNVVVFSNQREGYILAEYDGPMRFYMHPNLTDVIKFLANSNLVTFIEFERERIQANYQNISSQQFSN